VLNDVSYFKGKLQGIDISQFSNVRKISCLMKGVVYDNLIPLMMSGQAWVDKFREKMGKNMLSEFKILREFPSNDGSKNSLSKMVNNIPMMTAREFLVFGSFRPIEIDGKPTLLQLMRSVDDPQ